MVEDLEATVAKLIYAKSSYLVGSASFIGSDFIQTDVPQQTRDVNPMLSQRVVISGTCRRTFHS